MKIGDTIDVELKGLEPFRSKIIDLKGQNIYIHYPTEYSFSALHPYQTGAVSYLEHNIPHRFEANIQYYPTNEIPYIVMTKPDKDDIERIQRREYVRIQTDVDIAIYFKNNTLEPIVTVTQDISGGGLRAVTKKKVTLRPKELADVYMVLRSNEGDYEYIYTRAEVLRTHIDNGVHSLSMKFLLDDEQQRQKIIHHCFEVQRANRKHGLR